MATYTEKTSMQSFPIVILRQAVPFPSIPLRLDLDDDKSLMALHSSVDDCVFLINTVRPNIVLPTSKRDFSKVGVVAKIKEVSPTENEEALTVTFECLCRAEMIDCTLGGEMDSANVICKSVTVDRLPPSAVELKQEALDFFDHFTKMIPGFSREIIDAVHKTDNPGQLADFIAGSVFVRSDHKLAVLCEFDPVRRLKALVAQFDDEARLIENEVELHRRTRQRIEENQRDYYLREQMRVIREELGEDDEGDNELYEISHKILHSAMPDESREKLMKELKKLSKLPFASPESNVVRTYIETCLELPWGDVTADRLDLDAASKILEKDHDGMKEIKERILEFIAVRKLSGGNKNQILCLVGAPGVGKTSVASSIARALKRKFVRVSLGGVRDEADIRGHRKTYIGAMPGRIINALIDAGSRNPLILLDEIDKLTRDAHGDPASALLEVLDPDQNSTFRDHFIELPFDLSDCLFIATANTLDTIPRPLLDRMEVIELKSYNRSEKLSIAKNHLIGKQLTKHGMTKRQLHIDDEALIEIIDHYTREAGVRNLEREIAALCRKVARKLIENPEKKSYRIKKSDIVSYLGKPKVTDEILSPEDEIGVVNGLAYTDAGGDLLKVEAVSMDGSGKLELTGSLGDVMIESAKIALSVIRTRAKTLGIDPEFRKTKDIHIHFPEGAVPKDGPSAGVTVVTALASELSGIPVRRDVAMTGEVTLHGRVLPIGGLREKTMAAYKAGVTTVLIPKENKPDYDQLDDYIKEAMRFVFCATVDDVLESALVKAPGFPAEQRSTAEEKIPAIFQTPKTAGERHDHGYDTEFRQNNP